ncbi:MAG: ATPase, T2SS/T4P/T4SS family [Kiritimatiellia bacterium]|nr:ATPase, T2SS/T4P/T4SS family [Kiritimatiellia bacterium]
MNIDQESFSGKIAAILMQRGMISQPALQEALQAAQAEKKRLEEYLIEKQLVSDTNMTLTMAEYLGMAPINLAHFTPDSQLLELIPAEKMRNAAAVPVARIGKTLTVAFGDPFNTANIEEIQTLTHLKIEPLAASDREVKEVLQKCLEQFSPDLKDMFKNMDDSDKVEVGHEKQEEVNLDEMLESAEGAPVIRVVNSILVEALRRHASDIHIQPMEKMLRLRYRVDGDLYEVPSPPKNMQSAIISRIKIMSDMNIAERRIPQDGRFKVRALNKEVDVRVNLLPMTYGEKVAMRILDKSSLASSVAALGLDPKAYDSLIYAIAQPHGIILITGPTGSGKTTTLYSCLQDLNTIDVNVVTTEDPVEYQLAGINQVQIREKVGLTFANALRSILRQDPDIIMIGEIRDQETASIAVKSALTGHLVLSTLHTNDAAGAITRLRDMGIEAFLLSSSVIMSQSQRLYKKLCPACKKPDKIPADLLRINNIDPKYFKGTPFYQPVGCPKCMKTGFKGRSSIMEILMVDDDIRRLILQNVNSKMMTDKAIGKGMMTLKMIGLEKVKEGVSSLEEILSITGGE